MITAVIFDYGFGNVRSMARAPTSLSVDTTLTSDYRQPLRADGLIVPGVDTFAACMGGPKKANGDRVIYDRVRTGRPMLGVYVGEQTMFEYDLEHGVHATGIRLVGSSVNLLDANVMPHMGWDIVETALGPVLFNGVENGRSYLVYSYVAMEMKPMGASRFDIDLSDSPEYMNWCLYGWSRFVAVYGHGPLSVTQFHPEKSGDTDSQFLRNWIITL